MWRIGLLALVVLIAARQPAEAQGYPVTAGEHAGFTRVVVHAPPGIAWSLQSESRAVRLSLTPARAGFDLSRLFDRIARRRLAESSVSNGTLHLALGCDCRVNAWEERPGLIVLDIADPDIAAVAPAATPSGATPRAGPSPVASPVARPEARPEASPGTGAPSPAAPGDLALSIARSVGAALARRHTDRETAQAPAPELPDTVALLRGLGLPLAQALSQGLLDPASAPGDTPSLLQSAPDIPFDLPANMRITPVTDRPDPDAPPIVHTEPDCPQTEALDFLTQTPAEPFATAFARLSRQLYGEFDQPDPAAQHALVELYLSSGFGAEARRLIDTGTSPVTGRDLLLGVADVLENRNSNSRMRLAASIDCGGATAIFALLAGADRDTVPGNTLALVFTQLPPRLRAVIGAELAERLVAAGEVDAARIVAESLRRSPWVDAATVALVDAALARARGADGAAAARLDQLAPGAAGSQTVQRRLDLALDANQPVDGRYLDQVEALASAERDTPSGRALMAALIRLQARDGALDAAFDALDRLATWLPPTPENRAELARLADRVWTGMAVRGSDLDVVRAVLERQDWRDATRDRQTRLALAERLVALGVAPPVAVLIPDPQTAQEAVLRARAALERGVPDEAIALLSPYDDTAARATLAAAFEQAGRPDEAARTYASLDEHEAEARSAIAARDWARLRTIAAPDTDENPASGALTVLLGRDPGSSLQAAAPVATPDDPATDDNAPQTAQRAPMAPLAPAPTEAPRLSAPARRALAADGSAAPEPTDESQSTFVPAMVSLSTPPTAVPPAAAPPSAVPPSGPPPSLTPFAEAGDAPDDAAGYVDGGVAGGVAGSAAPISRSVASANPGVASGIASLPVETTGPSIGDAEFTFDRLGLVSRSAVLLSESARLREAIAPLLTADR